MIEYYLYRFNEEKSLSVHTMYFSESHVASRNLSQYNTTFSFNFSQVLVMTFGDWRSVFLSLN